MKWYDIKEEALKPLIIRDETLMIVMSAQDALFADADGRIHRAMK